MANQLKIDKDVLIETARVYRQCASDMKEMSDSLESRMETLRIDWNTGAGKEFFKKFDHQWVKNMDKYAEVLEHMANNLEKAKSIYEPTFQLAEEIKQYTV